ncbi:hypothetical protein PG994_008462 [Apiospora phragmitis]|uniref:FAD-binding domain-containing protein n=1 Tax=Apiospora phragmitis TaxID=2905665 RepID=A0ABR1UGI6_9PEZI
MVELTRVQLILDQEEPMGYAEWEHKCTPTYASNGVCIMGDAAHATSPLQGAGAGMVIEDAFILGHLIGNISSRGEINAAFRAFDVVRRPRYEAVGANPEKLNEALGRTFAHVTALELKPHKEEALETMRTLLSSM